MSSFARILVVADIFDALRAKRPYRDSLPLERVFEIMRAEAPRALDLPSLEALIGAKGSSASPAFDQPSSTPVQVQQKVQ
jgi:HD-GYP domain-containing protein (c-di-GMP phosphodiesterase class II)